MHVALGEDLDEQRDQLVAVHDASFVRGEPRVVDPRRIPHDVARPGEQPVVAGGQDERSVLRVERLVRHDVRVLGPHPLRDHAADQVVGRLVHHGGHAGVEQRHAHVATAPGDVALAQRRQHPHGGVQAGDHIEQGDARLRGFPVSFACDAHQPRHRLHDDVVAGPRRRFLGVRPERGQRTRHEPGIGLTKVVERQAEPRHQPRPEVLDQDVGGGHQAPDQGYALRAAEVGRHGPLVAVERQEVGGVVPGERRPPVPGVVALDRTLNLDDIGPQVGEHHGAERAGQDA